MSAKSAASDASVTAASVSSKATAAAAKASAAAVDGYRQTSTFSIVVTTIAITTTIIAGILAAVYYSGYADDILMAMAKKFYEGKAQAEAMALGKVGNEKAQAFLKGMYTVPVQMLGTDRRLDQLKKNPVMGKDELEKVSGGLGDEAVSEGLGGVSSKLGGLGGGLPKF